MIRVISVRYKDGALEFSSKLFDRYTGELGIVTGNERKCQLACDAETSENEMRKQLLTEYNEIMKVAVTSLLYRRSVIEITLRNTSCFLLPAEGEK